MPAMPTAINTPTANVSTPKPYYADGRTSRAAVGVACADDLSSYADG